MNSNSFLNKAKIMFSNKMRSNSYNSSNSSSVVNTVLLILLYLVIGVIVSYFTVMTIKYYTTGCLRNIHMEIM